MNVRATVLIPTHDHGPTLRHAAGSALNQTVSDLEVLIVGDGASDETREVAMTLEKDDDRVRFFDNPKGPRHGEVHRHAALRQATGDIVCYLSDDDLWLPEHVELLTGALHAADFAHTMTARMLPDGGVATFFGDVADPRKRALLLTRRWNFIPLSSAGHTMAAYRRLPEGWRTTPDDLWTDLHMWRQFLADPACVAVSVPVPTVIHFASAEREGRTIDDRLGELDAAAKELDDPVGRAALVAAVYEASLTDVREELTRTGTRLERFERRAGELEAQVTWLEGALAKARADRDALNAKVGRMERSTAWRLREGLLRTPVAGTLFRRRAARARSRRAPR